MAVVGTLGAAGAGLTAPAVAGGPPPHEIVVEKVVTGTQPPGSTFTIQMNCTTGNLIQTVSFDGPDTFALSPSAGDNECTFTEPDTGGAANVLFACEDDPPASECTSPSSINVDEPGTSRITVTNEFPPPPGDPGTPATPVPGTPRFTG